MDYRRISTLEQLQLEKWKTRAEMGQSAKSLRAKASEAVNPRAALLPSSVGSLFQYVVYAATAVKAFVSLRNTLSGLRRRK